VPTFNSIASVLAFRELFLFLGNGVDVACGATSRSRRSAQAAAPRRGRPRAVQGIRYSEEIPGIRTIGDFANLTAAMERAGWPEAKIRKVMGENWLRLLAKVWVE
jgi:microsomal dipeptidase-like Zn-dependent dipeptidase